MNQGSTAAELHDADRGRKSDRVCAAADSTREHGEGGSGTVKHTASHREEPHSTQMCTLWSLNHVRHQEAFFLFYTAGFLLF